MTKYEIEPTLWERRLRAVAEDADRCESCSGARWYRAKYRWILAHKRSGWSMDVAVAVYANLSANATVDENDRHFVAVVDGRWADVKTFNGVKLRVLQAIDGDVEGSLTFVNAAKIVNFFHNIRHPWTDAGAVTVDRHAADILTNYRPASKAILARANLAGYESLAAAYRTVAAMRGERPHELQATTWVHWVECMSRDDRIR